MDESAKPVILVVDDTEVNIDLMVDTLGDDYEVSVAIDGESALESVEEDPPDLILLDIMMPGMDGYEVCRRLQSETETRDIPIIFVTAKTELDDEIKGFRLGAVDYITKPVSPPRVRERVRTHLALREARRQLEAQNASLVEAARLREDVDAIMRHDLKGPLSSIIGLPETIAEKGNLDPDQRASLGAIEASGYRLLNMVNLSLDLMKMERGEYPFKPSPVEMVVLVRKIHSELDIFATSRDIEIRLTVNGEQISEGSTVYMMGEELLCYSMLSNLIRNAVEAAPVGSVVAVDLNEDERGCIRVHNQGAVPRHIREHFFDKFVTSGKASGTGLGTYSARLIAETQKGRIRMSTSDRKGTTIYVMLPFVNPDAIELAPDASKSAARAGAFLDWIRDPGLDILLVDDDPFNLRVLEKFLSAPLLRTDTAENGKIAFEKIQSVAYDAVFMDMEMPVLNGVETVNRIRRMESAPGYRRKRLVSIALSAHDDPEMQKKCMDAGFDAYLKKPAGKNEIAGVIDRFFADDNDPHAKEDQPPTDVGKRARQRPAETDSLQYHVTVDADLEELIPSFLRTKREELEHLRSRLDAWEFEPVRQISHKLKGAFNMYGFRFLSDACAAIESASSLRDTDAIRDRLATIDDFLASMTISFTEEI